MAVKTFDEFVKEQVSRAEELKLKNEIDWPQRLEAWQDELKKLYSDMEKFLKKYIYSGKIKHQRDWVTVSESNFESYEAEQLTFNIGTGKVVAKPISMQTIGANGRVDLIGQRGSIKIVLLEKGFLRDSSVDRDGWYIVTSPPPNIAVTHFVKESFQEAIMELADG